ncbi:CBS domain-containing protein [Chloroflexota bacterium]
MFRNAKVTDLMLKTFVRVTEDEMIWDVIKEVNKDKRTRLACVVDKDDRLKGIITPKMFIKKVMVAGLGSVRSSSSNWGEILNAMTQKKAWEIMAPPQSVRPTHSINEALQNMLDNNLYEIPVVDESNKVIGELNFFKIIVDWAKDAKREQNIVEEE